MNFYLINNTAKINLFKVKTVTCNSELSLIANTFKLKKIVS